MPTHAYALLAEVLLDQGEIAGAREVLGTRAVDGENVPGEGAVLRICAEMRLRVGEGRFQDAVHLADSAEAHLRSVANPAWRRGARPEPRR